MSRERLVVGILIGVLSILSMSEAMLAGTRIVWPNDGYNWGPWPDPNRVGNCHGNCGVDCSAAGNICGGGIGSSPDTWTLRLKSQPRVSGTYRGTECVLNADDGPQDEGDVIVYGTEYEYYIDRMEAPATWEYAGMWARLCRDHDTACREGNGCGLSQFKAHLRALGRAFSCGGATLATWSYDTTVYAWKNARRGYRATGQSCVVS